MHVIYIYIDDDWRNRGYGPCHGRYVDVSIVFMSMVVYLQSFPTALIGQSRALIFHLHRAFRGSKSNLKTRQEPSPRYSLWRQSMKIINTRDN